MILYIMYRGYLTAVIISAKNIVVFFNDMSKVRPPLWSSSQEFLAANTEVPGSIPGSTRFSE
jgi:hypothetical protein